MGTSIDEAAGLPRSPRGLGVALVEFEVVEHDFRCCELVGLDCQQHCYYCFSSSLSASDRSSQPWPFAWPSWKIIEHE